MIKNILVGYDDSRSAQVALEQAIDLAEALSGRVHLLVATPDQETPPEPEIAAEPQPLDIVEITEDTEEVETETSGQRQIVPPFVQEARLKLQEAHVGGGLRITISGRPATCLREEADLADLVVIGRGGGRAGHSWQVGPTTRQLLQGRLARPTLICASQYIEPESLLLVYRSADVAGRALSMAGEVAATLNIILDVVTTARDRHTAQRLSKQVKSALLAYHTEGDVVPSATDPQEALLTQGLQRNPSIVVIPEPPPPAWSWQISPLYTAALQVPDAMILVVP